ncbi:protein of unknown function [Pararobbsia alpina]|uniref:helix-turn-helix domain-containing transcriptional regulator n=1 Tax=Pararobbsia alpina TaxID=621374 RepID=UPI0039A4A1A9
MTTATKFIPFDAANYLNDDEAICLYLRFALESGDEKEIAAALEDVERAMHRNQTARPSPTQNG